MAKRAAKGITNPEAITGTATGTTLEAPLNPEKPAQRQQPKKRKPKK
jgi:hypothetical protein